MKWRNPRKGEAHHAARLTAEAVRIIRTSPQSVTNDVLAQRFRVGSSTISSARRGQSWKHVEFDLEHFKKYQAVALRRHAKLIPSQVREIRAVKGQHAKLAKRFGLSKAAVWRVQRGWSYKTVS